MPNKNAYFAMALADPLREALSTVALQLADEASHLASSEGRSSSADTGRSAAEEMAAGGDGSSQLFDPVETRGLHMTAFFAGEHLASLDVAALAGLHRSLQAATRASVQPCRLEFRGLQLFPPGKHNLVVAVFQASDGLRELQHTVKRLALAAGIADSDSVRRQQRHPGAQQQQQEVGNVELSGHWVPHVTLGKVKAPKASVGEVGRRLIQACTATLVADQGYLRDGPHGVDRLLLLGAIPRRKWCDWETLSIGGGGNPGDI